MIEVPDSTSGFIQRLGWSDDDKWAYYDLKDAIREHGMPELSWERISHSKLFGWPDWVQYEPEEMTKLDELHRPIFCSSSTASPTAPRGPIGVAAAANSIS